jgi:hypothetical protein
MMTRLRFRMFAILIGALFTLGMTGGIASAAPVSTTAGQSASVVADGGHGDWHHGHYGHYRHHRHHHHHYGCWDYDWRWC